MKPTAMTSAVLAAAVLAGCGTMNQPSAPTTTPPAGLRIMKSIELDGVQDDLVTAGVGQAALLGGAPIPTLSDPARATAAELRRAAIARSFDKGSGEGVLFGSNIDPATRAVVAGDGKIAGREFLAFQDDGSGKKNVAMLLQVPRSFDPAKPCVLVVAVPSANRLYTAIPTGAWGLRRGCAAVYTDKGGGNGLHHLASNTVLAIDGVTADAAALGGDSHYTSDLSVSALAAYLAQYPNRISVKPYGRRNTFADWGADVVSAARFALHQLNALYRPQPITRQNTTVILAGLSSGGGAALMGAEADTEGFIDGVVVIEPQIQPAANPNAIVERGGRRITAQGKGVLDYLTTAAVYMQCAGIADPNAPGADAIKNGMQLCESLKQKGLLTDTRAATLPMEAQQVLYDYGYDPASAPFFAINGNANPLAPVHSMASAFGKFGVEDKLCNFTVAQTVDAAGKPSTPTPAQLGTMWLNNGGYAPQLIYEDSVGGPVAFMRGVSPSTGREDYSLDGALCLRALLGGSSPQALRVQQGVREVAASGKLHGKPVIIVHGREDARVPATLSSRLYLGLNSLVEGAHSKLRYIEITNTSHTNSKLYDPYVVPFGYYDEQALNMMWEHLKNGAPLPPSQVVRTKPRGKRADGSVPDLTVANVPAIARQPGLSDRVTVSNGVVNIPD